MKKQMYVFVSVTILLLIVWTAFGQTRSIVKTTWEYKVIDTPTQAQSLERQLNSLGADGWEFVSIASNYLVFKRPKP